MVNNNNDVNLNLRIYQFLHCSHRKSINISKLEEGGALTYFTYSRVRTKYISESKFWIVMVDGRALKFVVND